MEKSFHETLKYIFSIQVPTYNTFIATTIVLNINQILLQHNNFSKIGFLKMYRTMVCCRKKNRTFDNIIKYITVRLCCYK